MKFKVGDLIRGESSKYFPEFRPVYRIEELGKCAVVSWDIGKGKRFKANLSIDALKYYSLIKDEKEEFYF